MRLRCSSILLLLAGLFGCASAPPVNNRAAEANAELGLKYMQQGDYETAMNKLKRAFDFNPEHPQAHHYMAELYRRLGIPVDAEKHYKLALEYSDNDTSLYNNYGVFLCNEGRLDEAVAQFNKILVNPLFRELANVNENLGLCYQQAGKLEQAKESFRKALRFNQKLTKTLFSLAEISVAQQEWLPARAYLQRWSEVEQHNAASLALAITVEQRLEDRQAVSRLGLELMQNFPESEQAKLYQQSIKP